MKQERHWTEHSRPFSLGCDSQSTINVRRGREVRRTCLAASSKQSNITTTTTPNKKQQYLAGGNGARAKPTESKTGMWLGLVRAGKGDETNAPRSFLHLGFGRRIISPARLDPSFCIRHISSRLQTFILVVCCLARRLTCPSLLLPLPLGRCVSSLCTSELRLARAHDPPSLRFDLAQRLAGWQASQASNTLPPWTQPRSQTVRRATYHQSCRKGSLD